MKKTIFLTLAFICLVMAIGFAGSSDNGNGSDLYPLVSCVFILLFGLFSVLSGAIVFQQHCVYFSDYDDVYTFLYEKGNRCEVNWSEDYTYCTYEGWTVYIVTEQEALMHKNDTRWFNHILVNLGLKSE